MSSQKLILMSTALLLLGGCGGEDNSSSQASSRIMAPLAGDAFEVLSKNDGQTTVSLRDAVIDPQGLPLTLESVVATGQGCEAPTAINAQALTFTVDNAKPELCFYRYSVKNHPTQASLAKASEANSYVLKSASATSLLPPLSETTQVGTPIPINIAAVTGYTLDSDVVVLGDGGAVVDGSTITYTPNAQGVTRLIYTMTSDDGTDMMTGTIDVAVSDVGNTAPEVVPVELATQPDDAGYFNIDETYTIDLSGYVSDADGDDVQLIEVKAWNASVALAAPEDPANLSFTFQTSQPGAHYVTYVVSDHRGGYSVEQVRIEAYDLSSVATWDDIQKGAKLFSAPLTQSEALISEAAFTSSHIDSNGSNVATFSFTQAQSLCESKGHLPTSEDLAELYGFEGGPASAGKDWPVDIAYWANDGGTAALVNLASGAVGTESASGHYVTCINEGGFAIDTASSDVEAVANGADKATIVVKLTFNGNPVEGQSIDASTTNTNVTFDATSGTTDNNGSASFALSSLVAEEVPVSITYSGETLTQNVTFIADESTSTLSLEVTKDSAVGDGSESNEVEATMVDINLNPLVGRTVAFESDAGDSVTITPAGSSTDATGKQKASVVWSGDALTEDTPVNITARFTPSSTGTEITGTATVTFVSAALGICGGAVNDNDTTNAAGNCLKVSTDSVGNWFTSTPSVAVMDALGYTVDDSSDNAGNTYASSYTEDGTDGPSGGQFARFRYDGRNAFSPLLGGDGSRSQFDRWCDNLASMEFAGKSTWRRPSQSELVALYTDNGNMWAARGWPSWRLYWSSSIDSLSFVGVSLGTGVSDTAGMGFGGYASCIAPMSSEATLLSVKVPVFSFIRVGETVNLTAQGNYSDGTTMDITSQVSWVSADTSIATVDAGGMVTGVAEGGVDVTATLDGIVGTTGVSVDKAIVDPFEFVCGGALNDSDKSNATGNCLKVATDADGNWFTSTPSVAVMDALGYVSYDSDADSGKTYAVTYTEDGTYGPDGGEFARFRQDGASVIDPDEGDDANAGVDGQFDRWCQDLAAMEFAGKSTWRRPTSDELEGLYAANGDMWEARGWPATGNYWSSTVVGSYYRYVNLNDGVAGVHYEFYNAYASCVSNP